MSDEQAEMRQWLVEFMTRVNTQDNRGTATPYFYQLRKPVRRYGMSSEHADNWVWMDEEWNEEDSHSIYETVQQLVECNIPEFEKFLQEHDIDSTKAISEKDTELLAEWLNIYKEYYRDTHEYEGAFLTEEAILHHIKTNQHNLPKGTDTYLQYAYRNPELKKLLACVGQLVGVPYERK